MQVDQFLKELNVEFYTGVPDSQLRPICDYLMSAYGTDPAHHIVAANEGNAVAVASGYHMATGRIPAVYMQNSGEGNVVNPVASLTNKEVYAIPMLFLIGWRGEPGTHDEPQHIYQGKITLQLLEDMDITYAVVGEDTSVQEVRKTMARFRYIFGAGKSAAFVIRKGTFENAGLRRYSNRYRMVREDAIKCILECAGSDPIVSTTGKISRELYEARMQSGESHRQDLLTVGSMGHCSSIALGIALQKPGARIWCIDGDGAVLMHMGAMAVIGLCAPPNLVHVVLNNEAHETVGGIPTAASRTDFPAVARACGYEIALSVDNRDDLKKELIKAKERKALQFIEIKCALESRSNLGRPAAIPEESKKDFVRYLGNFMPVIDTADEERMKQNSQ